MLEKLPRREREVLEILHRLGKATAVSVRAEFDDHLSDSAVRTLLRRLEAKGAVRREGDSPPFVYASVQRPADARASALRQVVDNFFAGSGASAATALLGQSKRLTEAEAEALQKAIDAARRRK